MAIMTVRSRLSEFGTGLGEAYDCAAFFAGDIGVASGKAISKVRFTLQGTRDMTGLGSGFRQSFPNRPLTQTSVCMM